MYIKSARCVDVQKIRETTLNVTRVIILSTSELKDKISVW